MKLSMAFIRTVLWGCVFQIIACTESAVPKIIFPDVTNLSLHGMDCHVMRAPLEYKIGC